MPKILIDITRLLGRSLKGRLPTGVDRVGLAYLRYFCGHCGYLVRIGGRMRVLPPQHSKLLTELLLESPPYPLGRLLWGLIASSLHWRQPKHGALLLNTGHSGLEHADYPRWVARYRLRPIVFVHDLIPISHPQFSRKAEPAKHVVRMQNALSAASGILVNSAETLRALATFAHCCGLPMPPTEIALLAPAPLPPASSQPPLERPYFLVLGTIEGRKNHRLLLSIWRGLTMDAPKLVLIGQRGWRCESEIEALDHDIDLKGKVIELSRCPDQELASWLAHARALLFPSFIEGYGMPLAEALAAGTPVIASDLAVFREIAGDVPDYLDPSDEATWQASIRDYSSQDGARRIAQLERLRAYRPPSWKEHFEAVEKLLERIE